jgi:hypothetical protein
VKRKNLVSLLCSITQKPLDSHKKGEGKNENSMKKDGRVSLKAKPAHSEEPRKSSRGKFNRNRHRGKPACSQPLLR